MKTEAQLEMIKRVPLEKLLLETGMRVPAPEQNSANVILSDAPWCSLTGGHASRAHLGSLPMHLHGLYMPPAAQPDRWQQGKAVKGRNEPCAIGAVAHVVAQ
jgi:TatD DNase family protein